MTTREQLQEQYEDTLFAIMMSELAEKEGKQLWEENERLKQDPSATVPQEVQKRCIQTIRREFRKRGTRTAARIAFRTLAKTAIVISIIATLFLCACAASETLRTNVLNLVIEVTDKSADFYLERPADDEYYLNVVIGWVPENYILMETQEDIFGGSFFYRKSETEKLLITYTLAEGTTISIDGEDAERVDIEINGHSAVLLEKNGKTNVIWLVEDGSMFIDIIGTGIDRDILIHIAEQIIY